MASHVSRFLVHILYLRRQQWKRRRSKTTSEPHCRLLRWVRRWYQLIATVTTAPIAKTATLPAKEISRPQQRSCRETRGETGCRSSATGQATATTTTTTGPTTAADPNNQIFQTSCRCADRWRRNSRSFHRRRCPPATLESFCTCSTI